MCDRLLPALGGQRADGGVAIGEIAQHLRDRFPDEASGFDSFEEEVRTWERRFERGEKIALGADRLLLHTDARTARRLIATYATNLASRTVNLADGLVELLNAENVHATPPVARALYETCAVATYMRRNLIPLLVKKRPKRAKVMLFRLGLGNAAGPEWGKLKPYQVRAFVKSMAQDAAELAGDGHDGTNTVGATMHRLYTELSELTHPNSMATMLSITLETQKPPKWELRPSIDDAALGTALGTADLAMHFGGLAWDEVVNTAQQHPLLLPLEEEFGPHDLHDLPESTADADVAVEAGLPDARLYEGDL